MSLPVQKFGGATLRDADRLRVSSVRPGREIDMLITAGERKAAALLSLVLQDLGLGVPADSFLGAQADTVHAAC